MQVLRAAAYQGDALRMEGGGGGVPLGQVCTGVDQTGRTIALLREMKAAAPAPRSSQALTHLWGEVAYTPHLLRPPPLGGMSQTGSSPLWADPFDGGLPGSPLRTRELLSHVQLRPSARPGDPAAGRCPPGHSPLHFAHWAGEQGEKTPKGDLAFLLGQPEWGE